MPKIVTFNLKITKDRNFNSISFPMEGNKDCTGEPHREEQGEEAIYIARHGEREDWINPTWNKDGDPNRQHDPPLSQLGFQQGIVIELLFEMIT